MNILVLINEFERGGAERVASNLLNYLPKKFSGSKFYLFLLEKSQIVYPIPDHVEIIFGSSFHSRQIFKFFKLRLLALRLRKVVREKNITLVLSFLTRANYVNALALSKATSHHAIISERNTPSWVYPKGTLAGMVNRLMIKYLYNKCSRIIAVSEGVRNDLVSNFKIPEKRISVIYNPFDIEKIEDAARETADHPWFREGEFRVVVNVGRLERQKNQQLLINAFQSVAERLADARLLIIGEGKERAKLTRLINRLGLREKIDLTGLKVNPFAFLAKAHVFVLSSSAEGFPNVLVEAMICGCPVISTDCQSGPAEIIKNNENGILVPVNDKKAMSEAMINLLGDAEMRTAFRVQGQKCARNFNLDSIVRQYAALISEQ